jgi:hypothetical protein
MCVSPCLLCFLFCMFTLCHVIEHMCVNAPPSGLPIPDPIAFISLFTDRPVALLKPFRLA